MPTTNYKTIICEGGDQTGKADAILTFSEKILNMGIPVTYASFPVYATPFGTAIRLFLRQGLEDLKLSKLKELKAKMAMYALNRLEFMDVFLSNPKFKDTVIVLDRSPFSNALTVAYGLANYPEMRNYGMLNQLIDYAMELDGFMIKKLNLTNCVFQTVTEDDNWDNVRHEDADINENEKVQKAAMQIYDMYEDRIKEGWKKILTKTKDGWREREAISDEIYRFFIDRVGDITDKKVRSMLRIRYEIGIEEILKHIYKGEVLPEGVVCEYLKALRTNDKDNMHKFGCMIGTEVGVTCKTMSFKNKGVRQAARKIVNEVPEVLDVLSYFISEDFPDKFLKAIDDK